MRLNVICRDNRAIIGDVFEDAQKGHVTYLCKQKGLVAKRVDFNPGMDCGVGGWVVSLDRR